MENEIEAPSVKSLAFKWGLILGVISIVLFLTVAMTGLQGESWVSWVGVLPTVIILYLAHKEFKDSGDGYMSYGKGLGIGTFIVAVSSVISSIFSFVYIKFVDPTYVEVILEAQALGMQEQGMSDTEIETAMSFTEGLMKPETMVLMGIFFGIFFGFILSLIVSAITKNSNPALDV